MIIIKFLNFVCDRFAGTGFNIDFDGSLFSVISSIWNLLCYVFPMGTILFIIGVTLLINTIKLGLAIWKFILDIVPVI